MTEKNCNLCARKCNVSRVDKMGYCGAALNPKLAKASLHFGEEPCVTGKNGSGTVFFSGCSLGCVFCQNNSISNGKIGKEVTVNRLAEIFRELEESGAENINLVTPTHYVDAILSALDIYKPAIPIVYNSGGYDTEETILRLKDYVDVYLMDFKYFDNQRAVKYSKAENYPETVKKALLAAAKNVGFGCEYNINGVMQKGLIVRHLIMPLGTNDAVSVIKWCNENLPFAVFSLMSQYTPIGKSERFPELNRKITQREYNKVLDELENSDFSKIYVQDLSSATDEYIPDFDLSGI